MNSSKVGNPLSSIKASNLVLIPKVSSLSSANDLRPIARSNVACRCMSQLWCLRTRLMGVLLYYSSESRSFCARDRTRLYSKMLCYAKINQGTTVEQSEIVNIPECYFMSRYESRSQEENIGTYFINETRSYKSLCLNQLAVRLFSVIVSAVLCEIVSNKSYYETYVSTVIINE